MGKLAANVRIVFQRVLVVHQLQLFRRMVFISQIRPIQRRLLFSRACILRFDWPVLFFPSSFRIGQELQVSSSSMILKHLKR